MPHEPSTVWLNIFWGHYATYQSVQIWLCIVHQCVYFLHYLWPSRVVGCKANYDSFVQGKLLPIVHHHASVRENKHQFKVGCALVVDQGCLDVLYLQFTIFIRCWQVSLLSQTCTLLPCTEAFVRWKWAKLAVGTASVIAQVWMPLLNLYWHPWHQIFGTYFSLWSDALDNGIHESGCWIHLWQLNNL